MSKDMTIRDATNAAERIISEADQIAGILNHNEATVTLEVRATVNAGGQSVAVASWEQDSTIRNGAWS